MHDPFDLAGRTALVTGAGSDGPGWSNGKATAVTLATRGAHVVVLDLYAERAEETTEIIMANGGSAEVATGDVTRSESVKALFGKLADEDRRIDILVNNVGGSIPGDCVTMDEDVWDSQMAYNLKSAFLLCKSSLPSMIAQKRGAIVNIGSVSGVRGSGDTIAYSTAKAGLLHLTRQIALRHAADGVRCNSVVPGVMHTPMVETRLLKQRGGTDLESYIRKRNESVPMGMMGDAWDVANAVLFMASDASRYVTGATLIVDGGVSLVSFR